MVQVFVNAFQGNNFDSRLIMAFANMTGRPNIVASRKIVFICKQCLSYKRT